MATKRSIFPSCSYNTVLPATEKGDGFKLVSNIPELTFSHHSPHYTNHIYPTHSHIFFLSWGLGGIIQWEDHFRSESPQPDTTTQRQPWLGTPAARKWEAMTTFSTQSLLPDCCWWKCVSNPLVVCVPCSHKEVAEERRAALAAH